MVSGRYAAWQQTRMLAQQQSGNVTLNGVTSVGLPGFTTDQPTEASAAGVGVSQ